MLYPAELGARDFVGLPAGHNRLAWTAGQRATRAGRHDHLEEEGIVKRGPRVRCERRALEARPVPRSKRPVARLAKPVEKLRGMS